MGVLRSEASLGLWLLCLSLDQQFVPVTAAAASCHRREALDSGNFEAGASYIDTFMDLEEKYGPVSDGDGQQAAEQEQVRGAQHTMTARHSRRLAGKQCMVRVS